MQLELKNINKSFGTHEIFHQLDFEFTKCGLYLLCSESGGGKTTLLNIIAGYENFQEGERNIAEEIEIACIFQSYELLNELTVKDNIRISMEILHQCSEKQYEMIINELGLNELLEHYPQELSQGQKQRVGIARALVRNPHVIVCDEPTESLDIENKNRVLKLLKQLSQSKVVIIASHEEKTLSSYYDYKYRIISKRLVLIDESQKLENISVEHSNTQADIKKGKQFLHKILRKRNVLLTGILSILMCFQIGAFQISTQIFTKEESMDAVNKDVITVKLYEKEDLEKLNSRFENVQSVLPFDHLNVKGRMIHSYIQPYPENNTVLKDNEIIINQNTAEIISNLYECKKEKLIGQTLYLTYTLDQMEYTWEVEIKKIITEKDVVASQIYYSKKGLDEMLKAKYFRDGMSRYDFYEKNTNSYQFNYPCDQAEYIVKQLNDTNIVKAYHSIYSMKEEESTQYKLYRLIFNIMQCALFIIGLLYTLYYAVKDTSKYLYHLAILHVSGLPFKSVQKSYRKEKMKYLLLYDVLPLIEIICYFFIFNVSLFQLIMMFVYVLFINVVYFIGLYYQLLKFNQINIANILRDL